MTPAQKQNLGRLLRPSHIAVIGGNDAEVVIRECDRIGFDGPIWPVNSRRQEIAGRACFRHVKDLPEPPDAVFVAVPRDAAVDVIRDLAAIGAGGVVCYTAGFSEVGEEGVAFERAMLEVAGDLAIVGPNCYGLISFIDKVALWPFAHTGFSTGTGAAIVTQSGMLSSDLLMAQRSVPLSYMVSAGNQSVLGLEDFVDVFIDLSEVRAIGLHIEGLRDVSSFVRVARRALEASVPIVVLKTGVSEIGSQLTVSHTGSLSGSDDLYNALFNQLGIIRVDSPAALLETLKFICVCGIPEGSKLAGFTCSGGGATMLADYAEKISLEFTEPSRAVSATLKELLPYTATVSNPLDYTTPIWGDPESLPPVLSALLGIMPDAAIIVQDYPLPQIDEHKPSYLNDAKSFIACVSEAGIPGAVCSTLPENIDQETREFLIKNGVAPMQGINECLDAIAKAASYGRARQSILDSHSMQCEIGKVEIDDRVTRGVSVISEWRAKDMLRDAGVQVPRGRVVEQSMLSQAAADFGFPLVLKWASRAIAHKTELGAVVTGIKTEEELVEAATQMTARLKTNGAASTFLVEQLEPSPALELLVSVRQDPQFGMVLAVGAGGVLSELLGDVTTVLLPSSNETIVRAIQALQCAPLITGYRGSDGPGFDGLLGVIRSMIRLIEAKEHRLLDVEVNPLFLSPGRIVAVDALARRITN